MALEIKEIIVKVTVDTSPKQSGDDWQSIKKMIQQTRREILEECREYIRRIREDKFER